jgi:hypothetical protein
MTVARMHSQRTVKRASWEKRFTKQRRIWRGTTKFARPTLASISPTTAVKGGANLTLTCTGTGFTPDSIITFNNGDESTTYVSATSLTTVVKPSLVTVAGVYPVNVRNGPLFSTTPRNFTFTDARR